MAWRSRRGAPAAQLWWSSHVRLPYLNSHRDNGAWEPDPQMTYNDSPEEITKLRQAITGKPIHPVPSNPGTPDLLARGHTVGGR
jgi:hypothetical protein